MLDRHPIEKERGIRIVGSLRLEHSTVFLLVTIVFAMFLMFIMPFGMWLLTTLLLLLAFWGIFVYVPVTKSGKSLLAVLYRRASFDLGQNEFFDSRVTRGSMFKTFGRLKNEFPKRLGKIKLIMLDIPGMEDKMCVFEDVRESTYTLVIYLKISSLVNCSTNERENRTDAFRKLLDCVKKHDLYRFSWQMQVLPGEEIDLKEEQKMILYDNSLPQNQSPEVDRFIGEYQSMINELSSERLVSARFTVKKDDPRFKRRRKGSSGPGELVTLVSEIVEEVGLAARDTNPFGVTQVELHTYNEAILDLGSVLDPVSRLPLARKLKNNPELQGKRLDESLAFPTVCGFEPGYAFVGETVFKSFFIESFSEFGLTPTELMWLVGLQREDGKSQALPITVTTVYQPVPRSTAKRLARYSRNTTKSILADRRESGKAIDADLQREAEIAEGKIQQLASSQSETLRMRVYVSVVGSSIEEVSRDAETLRATAVRNNCLVQGLTLRQHEGVSVVLPLGRGLATLNTKSVFK